MNLETAREIAILTCRTHRRIEAIRLLRVNEAMSLMEAKHYLEVNSKNGESWLFNKLCKNFVPTGDFVVHPVDLNEMSIVLLNDRPIVDAQGQPVIFYRKIDAERWIAERAEMKL